jgi:hypothetical protein
MHNTYMSTRSTKSSIHLVSSSTPTPTKYTGFYVLFTLASSAPFWFGSVCISTELRSWQVKKYYVTVSAPVGRTGPRAKSTLSWYGPRKPARNQSPSQFLSLILPHQSSVPSWWPQQASSAGDSSFPHLFSFAAGFIRRRFELPPGLGAGGGASPWPHQLPTPEI